MSLLPSSFRCSSLLFNLVLCIEFVKYLLFIGHAAGNGANDDDVDDDNVNAEATAEFDARLDNDVACVVNLCALLLLFWLMTPIILLAMLVLRAVLVSKLLSFSSK